MKRSPRSWPQVAGLLVLAPVCAEYLAAYDDSTGHPSLLIGNLIIFIPLYGCAALLIREIARRGRLGWPGILLLAAAFGLFQAGVVDQSLFSPDYRGLEGWDAMYRQTLIAPLGLSAFNALIFVGGHVLASICGPVALIEATRPTASERPWLGLPGTIVVGLLWLAASGFVLHWHLTTETWHASSAQVIGASTVVLGLIVAAALLGRRWRSAERSDRSAPALLVVAGVMLLVAGLHGFAPETWIGVAMITTSAVVAAWILCTWSRRSGWSPAHTAVTAAAPLWVTAALAFTYDPMIGTVTPAAKYGHNIAMLAIVALTTVLAVQAHRVSRPDPEAENHSQQLRCRSF